MIINTTEEAQELVEKFIGSHPDCSVDALHFRQGTNSIAFRGTYQGKTSFYKVSIRGAADREAEAIRYFEPSALVPRLFYAEDNLLIEEFIEGETWTERILAGEGASPELLNSVGQAVVRFTEYAQRYKGLEAATFSRNLKVTLETAKLLLQCHADVYLDDIFPHTLTTILMHHDRLVCERPSLYYDDCAPDNILLRDGRFIRFVDLESCWQGTLSLHFGAFFERLAQKDGIGFDAHIVVAHFQQMFRQILPDLEMLQAAAFLKVWIPIVRYHGWNGWWTWQPGTLPEGIEREQERARWFADRLRRVHSVLASSQTT